VNGKSSNGKIRSSRLRLVPPRVAATWGDIELGDDVREQIGTEKVCLCSPLTLRRVKRRLGQEGDGSIYVKLQLARSKPVDAVQSVEEETKRDEVDGDEGVGVWLVEWEEMPDGCLVLEGAEGKYGQWGEVR
jgi:peroxin-1